MKNFFQAEAFWLRDIYKDSEQPLIGRFIAGEFGGYWLWHRQRDVARIWADENNCQGDHLAYSLISLKAGILLETFKVIFSLVNMNVAFTWACSVSTRSRRVASRRVTSRPWQANRKSQRSLSGVGVEWLTQSTFIPLTPKIWLLILPSSCETFLINWLWELGAGSR